MAAILAGSREKNSGPGLTGMLLYRSGNGFQVAEGERENVSPDGVVKHPIAGLLATPHDEV